MVGPDQSVIKRHDGVSDVPSSTTQASAEIITAVGEILTRSRGQVVFMAAIKYEVIGANISDRVLKLFLRLS